MPKEPAIKRAMAFVDGQNLFYAVKNAFGYTFPNYDIAALANAICRRQDWQLREARFYTGFPSPEDSPVWSHFWRAKFTQLNREGVHVFSRVLRYHKQNVILTDGSRHTVVVGHEKGIDVRLAIDVIRRVQQEVFDVAVLFSQDQDLSELAAEIRAMAKMQGRWIKVVSAFPISQAVRNPRGIDRRDYRPKARGQ
jgi:uncharacterized LabA/DUF88 family protein